MPKIPALRFFVSEAFKSEMFVSVILILRVLESQKLFIVEIPKKYLWKFLPKNYSAHVIISDNAYIIAIDCTQMTISNFTLINIFGPILKLNHNLVHSYVISELTIIL